MMKSAYLPCSCCRDTVHSHLRWNQTVQRSSAKSCRYLHQLLLLPAHLSGPHVSGWVPWHFWNNFTFWYYQIYLYFLICFGSLLSFRTLYQLPSSLQAEEEAFLYQEEEGQLRNSITPRKPPLPAHFLFWNDLFKPYTNQTTIFC